MLNSQQYFFIETYGCQMNFSDSEIVASILTDNGYLKAENAESSNVIFLNTCSIRDNAEQRIINRLKHLKALKKKKKNFLIGMLGCMAERLKDRLFEENIVDIVAGPDSYRELPGLINTARSGKNSINVLLSTDETYADINPVRIDSNGVSAFISIMRGCENFCAYCVVPFTRGKERSRNPETILKEAEKLFAEGYKEITLLGQNVNSYSWTEENNNTDFPELIEKVAMISPDLRVRFATSHPKDISDKLILCIAKYENICNSVHLPIQSGSNRILKMMNRKYTREYYLERIATIKKHIPDCGFSTDIICGFCSETDEDHKQTLEIMELVGYDYAFMFKYSERPDTTAAKKHKDDIEEGIKTKRLDEVIVVQRKVSHDSNLKDIGKTFRVLVDSVSKRSKAKFSGRTSQNKVVIFPDKNTFVGQYINVKITGCTSATLIGEIC
jgi:tRNA-2-methylthio-N6-dimethylallyladenosine synthase